MKIGLFSDIHGNLEAFEQVLGALKKQNVERYVFLGDLVGYGASPKECIQLLQQLTKENGCVSIAGNHDYAVCGRTPYQHYAALARESIDWTKKILNKEEMSFLSDLPLLADPLNAFADQSQCEPFTIVHANLSSPKDWGYVWDIDDAYLSFQLLKTQLCFIGHSHKPIVFTSGQMVDWFIEDTIHLKKDLKYIINVGSVGQPRDGNPQASFAVYDTKAGTVTIHRVDYDISKAQAKIRSAGLPKLLADRLAMGK